MNMNSFAKFIAPAGRCVRRGLILGIGPLLAIGALSISASAQDATPPAGNANAQDNGGGGGRRNRGGNFSPEARMEALKTQFGVTDDAQWAVISARVQAVFDLRLAAGGGFGFGGPRGQRGQGGGGGAGGGFQRPANPDADALRQALTDNMPDAEIKSRLDHLREVRKQNQAKLEKAQADLLAVLTPRQEAQAVMIGLLN
jgi:Spy/CpxP family protein refolding chaperone